MTDPRCTVLTGVNGLRVAIDLRLVDHVVELPNGGVQLVTADDLFAVRGEFTDLLAKVEAAGDRQA